MLADTVEKLITNLYEGAAVKGFRWRLAILIASWLRIWVRGQVPQPRSGALTAQDLRVHLNP
jgi:hypothetical protein